ncbi:MAG: glycosyltransferase family 2 protein [Candidatus Jordarchaeales archaeon]
MIIPAFNEVKTISCVVRRCLRYASEVIVVDDGSWDGTAEAAEKTGAKVIRHGENRGINEALKTGFREARGDIIVRVDGDGQHDPSYIPLLAGLVASGEADLVVGRRSSIPPAELLISALVWPLVRVHDAGSGFIAIRKKLAQRLTLESRSTCGTLLLEAATIGARIREVPIPVHPRLDGKRRLKINYLKHFLVLLKYIKTSLLQKLRQLNI